MDKVYTIFISSTYEDLKEYRQSAILEVLSIGHLPLVMENFNSHPDEPKKLIKKYLEKTDFFILILGNCYGSIMPDYDISFTEFEYNTAIDLGIPVFVFFSHPQLSLPNDKEIAERLSKTVHNLDERIRKLDLFKRKLISTRTTFKTDVELQKLIANSTHGILESFNRTGWTRNDKFNVRTISKEFSLFLNFIEKKTESNQEEYEKVRKSLFDLNNFLYPATKATPVRPVMKKSDGYLTSIVFVIKCENHHIAECRRKQFEEVAILFEGFHSAVLEDFRVLAND